MLARLVHVSFHFDKTFVPDVNSQNCPIFYEIVQGLSTSLTILLLTIHTAFFSEYYPPIRDLTSLLWLKIPIRLLAATGGLLIIYSGLGMTTWLTRNHFDSLRRSRFILGGQLVLTGICLILNEILTTELIFYTFAIPFVAICLTYGVKIIFWFHLHAKNADAVRKWQLRLSEIACILMVYGPTDLLWDWEKLPFRPNLLVYIIAYGLIIIVGTQPEWFQNLAFAIENTPALVRQNIALLSMIAERHADNPATKAEPWLRRLSQAIGLSSIQTHSIVRAAYILCLRENRELGELGLDTLCSPDTELILHYTLSRWDGQNTQFFGNTIPIESRILSLVFFWVIELENAEMADALNRLKAEAGKRFDPQLVSLLEKLVTIGQGDSQDRRDS